MKFEIITLFPEFFELSLQQSVIGKGWEKKLFDIRIINLRDFATDKHNTVDDTPCGGGGGMVLKLEVLDRCLTELGYSHKNNDSKSINEKILLTSAAGKPFVQKAAISYSLLDRVTLICGHYLGVDERILQLYDIDELSVGDYVLSGGEPAASVIVDAIARLIPGVLGNFESAIDDSYMNQITGSPCYTKPVEYMGKSVPFELLSGDHAKIKRFKRVEAIKKCVKNRPDLIDIAELSDDEYRVVEKEKNAE